MSGVKKESLPRRRVTDHEIAVIVSREHAGRYETASRFDDPVDPVHRRYRHMAGAIAQSRCTTAGFLRCCDRFYAQIDRDLAEYDFRRKVEMGIPQYVEMDRCERRHQKAMRRLVRNDIVRRGVRA